MTLFLLPFLLFVYNVYSGCIVNNPECYVDDNNRVLGSNNVNGYDGNNNEWCAQLCHNAGSTLSGTEFGVQCYCGDVIRANAQKAPASDCNMQCPYFANESCGGNWRISIAKVDCSGTPVPPPPEVPRLVNPCLNNSEPYHKMPFCDPTLDIDDRVRDAISRMSLDEKINIMGTNGGPINSLGLSVGYNWWSEATHGVQTFRADQSSPFTTNFAFPIATAMSFNRTLWWATGSQIGHEARALMNIGNAWSTFWAPVINLAREPRWGRNIETPGEDPYLTGQYAKNFVTGFQEAPEDPYHVLASACCKHYVANEMEDTDQDGIHHWRNEFDASVPIQDLIDSYMAPFQACVELGRVTGLMCSYNAMNGIPSCANGWLLTQVARGEWGFDGYVTSDCDADYDVYYNHHYTATPEETVRDVLRAGTDVDCGTFVPQFAPSALQKGLITEEDLNIRLSYLFRMRMRLGHFDPAGPLEQIPDTVVCSQHSKAVAWDGPVQSSALIKNTGNTLPLSAGARLNIAVIGPNSNLSQSIAGYYGPGIVCDNKFWNLVDAIEQYAGRTTVSPGVPNVLSEDTSDIPAAVQAASAADIVILAVGTDLTWAAEGHDAVNITWSYGQSQLIQRVAAAAKKPVIIVLFTATPLDISNELANDKIGAILHVGQPSIQTLGIGDLLFGKQVPAGRIVQTILPASYAAEISIFDFNMRPGPSVWPRPDCNIQPPSNCPLGTNPGRTYRFYTGKPVLPFGFGLSYTSFTYELVNFPADGEILSLDPVRKVLEKTAAMGKSFPSLVDLGQPFADYQVNVTNTGNYDADDVVLGFIVPPGAGQNGVPLKYLFGFERVHVPRGQTVSVFLYPSLGDFIQVDENGDRAPLAGEYTILFGLEETYEYGQGLAAHTIKVA
jgi:beta-glucosidase-like glycosyl hydrolase